MNLSALPKILYLKSDTFQNESYTACRLLCEMLFDSNNNVSNVSVH